jgi:hypothetical protein
MTRIRPHRPHAPQEMVTAAAKSTGVAGVISGKLGIDWAAPHRQPPTPPQAESFAPASPTLCTSRHFVHGVTRIRAHLPQTPQKMVTACIRQTEVTDVTSASWCCGGQRRTASSPQSHRPRYRQPVLCALESQSHGAASASGVDLVDAVTICDRSHGIGSGHHVYKVDGWGLRGGRGWGLGWGRGARG